MTAIVDIDLNAFKWIQKKTFSEKNLLNSLPNESVMKPVLKEVIRKKVNYLNDYTITGLSKPLTSSTKNRINQHIYVINRFYGLKYLQRTQCPTVS